MMEPLTNLNCKNWTTKLVYLFNQHLYRIQVKPLKSSILWSGTSLRYSTIPILKINYPIFLASFSFFLYLCNFASTVELCYNTTTLCYNGLFRCFGAIIYRQLKVWKILWSGTTMVSKVVNLRGLTCANLFPGVQNSRGFLLIWHGFCVWPLYLL